MSVNPNDMVVVLGEPSSLRLDVGSARSVLDHMNGHLQIGQPPFAEGELTPEEDLLRFFASDGRRLGLEVVDGGPARTLVETGTSVPLRELKSGVNGVLKEYSAYQRQTNGAKTKPKLDKDWTTRLRQLAELLDGSAGNAMVESSGSWFHNFFVHGWH